ncbi:hypothetical protein BaRGS_00013269, partial [Batillaria attramentaria]
GSREVQPVRLEIGRLLVPISTEPKLAPPPPLHVVDSFCCQFTLYWPCICATRDVTCVCQLEDSHFPSIINFR